MRRFGYIRASRKRDRAKWRSKLVRPGWPTLVAELRGEAPYPQSLTSTTGEPPQLPIEDVLPLSVDVAFEPEASVTEAETAPTVIADNAVAAAAAEATSLEPHEAALEPDRDHERFERFLALVAEAIEGARSAAVLEQELDEVERSHPAAGPGSASHSRAAVAFAERHLIRLIERARLTGSAEEREWLAGMSAEAAPVLAWIAERSAEIEAASHGIGLPEASVLVELRHARQARNFRRRADAPLPIEPFDAAGLERIVERDCVKLGPERRSFYLDGLKATARFISEQRSAEAEAARKADYWRRVADELGALAASAPPVRVHVVKSPAVLRWASPVVEPARQASEPETIEELIETKVREARARGVSNAPPPPAPLASRQGGPMSVAFPSSAGRTVDSLREQLRSATPKRAAELLRTQFESILPNEYKRIKSTARANPEFADIVAAIMNHGSKGHRLMLVPRDHPGVALIDVRLPRMQYVAQWNACIQAAAASERGSTVVAGKLAAVAALSVSLKIGEVAEALGEVGLHVAIGKTKADG